MVKIVLNYLLKEVMMAMRSAWVCSAAEHNYAKASLNRRQNEIKKITENTK
jgi:hypothetical protein